MMETEGEKIRAKEELITLGCVLGVSWTSYEDLEAVGKKCIAMKIVVTNI
jgi:hypothetical protein